MNFVSGAYKGEIVVHYTNIFLSLAFELIDESELAEMVAGTNVTVIMMIRISID